MKQVILFLTIAFFNFQVLAQVISLGNDTIICPGATIGIAAGSLTPPTSIVLDNPTTVVLMDDAFSTLKPIGFDFTFFGQSYSQICIGSNGIVSFNPAYSNGYCSWSISSGLPSTNYANSSIMACYMDLTYYNGAGVEYQTIGTAPNRSFVVFYNDPSIFQCATDCWSIALVLHETTNEFEVFLRNKPLCPNWNSGLSIQGVQNQNSTIGLALPQNSYPNLWTTDLDGKRWIPNGPNSYNLIDIPFVPVLHSTTQYTWQTTEGNSYAYSDTLQTLPQQGDSIGYFLGISSPDICSGYGISFTDTSWISIYANPTPNLGTLPEFCNSSSGSIFSTGLTADSNFYWLDFSLETDTLSNLAAGMYDYIYTNEYGCERLDSVEVGFYSTFSSEIVPPSCSPNNDGSIVINPDLPLNTYTWIAPSTAIGNSANNLLPGNYSCIVNSNTGCEDTLIFDLSYEAGINIQNLTTNNVTCLGFDDGSVSFNVNGAYPPHVIEWDGASIPTTTVSNIPSGSHQLQITNSLGCVVQENILILGPLVELIGQANVTDEMLGYDGTVELGVVSGDGAPNQYSIGSFYQSSPVFSGLIAGFYSGYIKDSFGCVDTVDFSIGTHVGIDEFVVQEFVVYPNPASNEIHIKSVESNYTVRITNLLGKVLLEKEQSFNSKIDVSALPSAAYIFSLIKSNGEIENQFVTIEK